VLEKPCKKLDVWQKSIAFIQKPYELTESFPRIENFGLTNQIRKAALSIAAKYMRRGGSANKERIYSIFPYTLR